MFDRLKSSLEEAEKFAAGELTLKTFTVPSRPPNYTPERISRIRKSLHMSQGVFAHVLNVSTKTVQSKHIFCLLAKVFQFIFMNPKLIPCISYVVTIQKKSYLLL